MVCQRAVASSLQLLYVCLFFLTTTAQAQELSPSAEDNTALSPFTPVAGPIVISERSDFSRYEDSRYTGFSYREARLDIDVQPRQDGSVLYRGEALVFEETLRDMRAAAKMLDTSIPVVFTQTAGGAVEFLEDGGYPILRGVPAPPPETVQPKDRWTAEATIVVRPQIDAPATRIKVLVEYEYLGPSTWSGKTVKSIKARYAMRYRGGDRLGDPDLTGASGSRTADILVDPENGSTLFIREAVDENYTYSGGSKIRLKGFILHFYRGSLPLDRDRVAVLMEGTRGSGTDFPEAKDTASGETAGQLRSQANQPDDKPEDQPDDKPHTEEAEEPAFVVAAGERGVVLLLYDLRFVPDGADLLPSERGRLDTIAEALKRIPEHSFLVEGHAADIGRPQGQYDLSRERARRIVDELAARGLPAGRFVYRGLGADQPIASNDTEQGRARNRRVEITILD